MNYNLYKIPQIKDIKKIFFVGIKGVGVAPLAIIASEAGFEIAGSDVAGNFITDQYLSKIKISIYEGFEEDKIADFFGDEMPMNCLVITTGAHKGLDNAQVKWAVNRGIIALTQGQALAVMMDGDILGREFMRGISVAGSHGKTTITSLLATTLKGLGLDPSYVIGTGEVFPLGAPGHLGSGEYFIAEADEYASDPVHDRVSKFLYQTPYYAIFNNVDFDHPDLFKDIDEVKDVFLEFAHNIKSGGTLFINGDDIYLKNIEKEIIKDINIVSYGLGENNNYRAVKIVNNINSMKFTVIKNGSEWGVFDLSVVGEHNVLNAMSVIALASEMGFEPWQINPCLSYFKGSKRRMEYIGTTSEGAVIIDDYGHHPSEIKSTLSAIKKTYPEKQIICIFQPHTFSRTKALRNDFANSFKYCHKLILLPIFRSARDRENDLVDMNEIVEEHNKNTDTQFFENIFDVVEYVKNNFSADNYVIVTMGAGNVYKAAEDLCKNYA